ncbi:hypothetical protein GALMADRAFT_799903 [Galerina marginata CBS 339.88]|uniref:Uncharacterized protein n=1 Tax=Galerina marginata (strain CBS 339.88) TaxID=685588 RepID=A0A067SKE2_GALM3|nr:hypothetical protein GALMADRAFT_799903 [Galerina marginata CBS 339.88]
MLLSDSLSVCLFVPTGLTGLFPTPFLAFLLAKNSRPRVLANHPAVCPFQLSALYLNSYLAAGRLLLCLIFHLDLSGSSRTSTASITSDLLLNLFHFSQ